MEEGPQNPQACPPTRHLHCQPRWVRPGCRLCSALGASHGPEQSCPPCSSSLCLEKPFFHPSRYSVRKHPAALEGHRLQLLTCALLSSQGQGCGLILSVNSTVNSASICFAGDTMYLIYNQPHRLNSEGRSMYRDAVKLTLLWRSKIAQCTSAVQPASDKEYPDPKSC